MNIFTYHCALAYLELYCQSVLFEALNAAFILSGSVDCIACERIVQLLCAQSAQVCSEKAKMSRSMLILLFSFSAFFMYQCALARWELYWQSVLDFVCFVWLSMPLIVQESVDCIAAVWRAQIFRA